MKHIRNWPDESWHFDFEVPASLSDRYGELVSIAGTVALDTEGQLRAPHDLDAQLELVMNDIEIITAGARVEFDSVAKLVAFYVGAGEVAYRRVIGAMAARFSGSAGPVLTAIPVDNLAFPGMMVEIEGYALADATGAALERTAAAAGTLRSGDWLFVEGRASASGNGGDLAQHTSEAISRLHQVLEENQCSAGEVVRLNVYYTSDDAENDLPVVGAGCAAGFDAPGPVVTFVPLPNLGQTGRRVEIDAIAMPGGAGQTPARAELPIPASWAWPVEWPFVQALRSEDAIFIGGQPAFDTNRAIIDPGDMVSQTRLVMDRIVMILEAFGATYDDVMKVGCWYNGGASVDVLKRNALIRTGYMSNPGGTSTGVPVQTRYAAGLEIQVDIVAMSPGS